MTLAPTMPSHLLRTALALSAVLFAAPVLASDVDAGSGVDGVPVGAPTPVSTGSAGSLNLAIGTELRLEAFPSLSAADDTLKLLDVSHEHTLLAGNSVTPGLDVSASYVWESPRFGQFVLSTNTTYVYNTRITDAVSDSVAVNVLPDTASLLGKLPELQSSLTFTWQFGNHSATATTRYTDALDNFGRLSIDQLNIEQLNELVGQITTLDLRYGYNVRTGRQGNTSFSVGLRNNFDRRPQSMIGVSARGAQETADRVAYGTIKYQF